MKKRLQAPAEVIAQFKDWQSPKRGKFNPEIQTNVVWSWLVQTRAWPHAAHRAAGKGREKSPGWCFSRFGQSETHLPDGTVIYIGGEHEDHYDPDFYIYNDVIVQRSDGSIEIYGYPNSIFPPTDFHSATLYDDEIVIIGGACHSEKYDHNDTLVFQLKLDDFSIHRVATQGDAPNWLFDHKAEMASDGSKIICTGGQVTHHPTERIVENLTTWEFDLGSKTWHPAATNVVPTLDSDPGGREFQ